MLTCKNIIKDYGSVRALDGISLTFRDQEFVSILGQSGCGKTTLLNIIGGLDQYTSGDLIINGRSTKEYRDQDWDTYRNHRVGFVFQSYNLIMHQSVLANVEMALTLTGVSKQERQKRALQALKEVGLADQVHKKPSQMSGGQMQRVAIARALVNDPEILLADEPTGALDSKTSVQIMELLKAISKNRLVIMVTHNPELARKYSTRIVELLDGHVISDDKPCDEKEELDTSKDTLKRPSMSFLTACSLSLNNLMTKKARTILVSFAGSIGIIGIALILSLSNGVQSYIDSIEESTMASYPIEIQDQSMDMTAMMSSMMNINEKETSIPENSVGVNSYVNDILESMSKSKKNNLAAFKSYIESKDGKSLRKATKAIEYGYDLSMMVYNESTASGLVQVSPNGLLDRLGFGDMMSLQSQFMSSSSMSTNEVWNILPTSEALRNDTYDLIKGSWPSAYNEVVLEVDDAMQISDFALYSLGLMDQDELVNNYEDLVNGTIDELKTNPLDSISIDTLMNTQFKLINNSDVYEKVNGYWIDRSDNEDFLNQLLADAPVIRVVGIVQPKEGSVASTTMGGVLYTHDLQDYVVKQCEESEIVQEQKSSPSINVFTGQDFSNKDAMSMDSMSLEQQMQMASMSQDELMAMMSTYNENLNATYESNLKALGVIDFDSPSSMAIYAKDFDTKEVITSEIDAYNQSMEDQDRVSDVITYNDFIGLMLSSVSSIVDMISYVLVGFVSVSLVVSSIMIGIITYISVLERTKEIGILRAMGARKKDISRVFNAETFIIGVCAGTLGIVVTVLLNIPISLIVEHLTGVANISSLPWQAGIILIAISMILTVIAGVIPSRFAAKQNPVEALRSE